MNLHLERDNFAELLRIIGNSSKIDIDILEKDYYVCVVLEQLARKQDELKAYFKGGTALYKKLNEMRRFSEDIDLTVRNDIALSNTQNKKKFELSAKGYSIDGFALLPDKTDNRKGSITAFYEYETVVEYVINPLRRSGEIQVEATSFTESEPLEDCEIQPLIYKFANEQQRQVLETRYAVKPYNVQIIKLERTFVDKLFAAQKYIVDMADPKLAKPTELAKHLYDIAVLFKEKRIRDLLTNDAEMKRIEAIRRREEVRRIGGIQADTEIKDFVFLSKTLDFKIMDMFLEMQEKYVLEDRFIITGEELKMVLRNIYEAL
jgi:hypothetical protein